MWAAVMEALREVQSNALVQQRETKSYEERASNRLKTCVN